jgi:ribose 1,5-bisphosphokinase
MSGRLIAIVGPSGSGKDTLLTELQKQIKAYFPIRFITRPGPPKNETYHPISETNFAALVKSNQFAFYWSAHGLSYGIPRDIDDVLLKGRDVVFNCSRSILDEIATKYPTLEIVFITASPVELKKRLISRGRESIKDINKRISRKTSNLPGNSKVVDNSTTIENGLKSLIKVLNQATGISE